MNGKLQVQLSRLIEIGRFDAADRLLRRAFSEAPADADNHFYAACVAEARDELTDARDHLGEFLRASPEHFEGRVLWARIARRSKQHSEAERVLLELLTERPNSAYLLALYAEVMLETLHVQKARALVDEALQRSPDEPLACVLDVLISLIEGDRSSARERLRRLVATSPRARHVALSMVTLLSTEGRDREALEIAQSVFRDSPGDPDLLDLVIELRARTHWMSIPAWPLMRFGWLAAIGSWVVVGIVVRVLGDRAPIVAAVVGVTWIVYCVYSWTYKPLLVRWLKWRGL
jgi:predicted Zn-dependent protease